MVAVALLLFTGNGWVYLVRTRYHVRSKDCLRLVILGKLYVIGQLVVLGSLLLVLTDTYSSYLALYMVRLAVVCPFLCHQPLLGLRFRVYFARGCTVQSGGFRLSCVPPSIVLIPNPAPYVYNRLQSFLKFVQKFVYRVRLLSWILPTLSHYR